MNTQRVIRSGQHRPFKLSTLELEEGNGALVGRFQAMGCPCEILLDTDDNQLANTLLLIAAEEAWRIEEKFSRYKQGSIVERINTGAGSSVTVDSETARLLDFADQCFRMTGGMFDITSGVLRKVWTFKTGERIPSTEEIEKVRAYVGWEKAEWNNPVLRLRPGMEIDLGGIGKEYAVDRVLELVLQRADIGVLINFGGDIAVGGKRRDGSSWKIGIESVAKENSAAQMLSVKEGAVATSGDTKRFILGKGKRYGHILNPKTGWPVVEAPQSVTVAAGSCTEAGFLSTWAILNGKNARSVLSEAGVQYWCY